MALDRLHLWLGREVGRQRRPSLVLHVSLHLMGVCLWGSVIAKLGVDLSQSVRRHAWLQVGRVLRVVDSRLRHVCVAVNLRRRLPGADRLADHSGIHPPDVVPGRWPGSHPRLGSMTTGAMCDKDAVGNWWRC